MARTWTNDELARRALLYGTRESFRTGPDGPAYQAALRKGRDFLDFICRHMTAGRRMLTQEVVAASALNYQTRTAFAKGDPPAYNKARTKGWLEEVCAHMRAPPEVWTRERILAIIPHCRHREDLKSYGGAPYAARRMGMYHEIEALLPNAREPWTPARIAAEAQLHTRRADFQRACPPAYKAAERMGIKKEVCAHMDAPLPSRNLGSLIAEASAYATPTDFLNGAPQAYRAAQARNLLDHVLDAADMDRQCMIDGARSCLYLEDFYLRRRPCYGFAARHGFLDDLVAIVGPTLPEMREIAARYSSRTELRAADLPAYRHAVARGWLDELMDARAGLPDPDAPTFVYSYRRGRRIYVGISIDLEMREGKHLRNSHALVREIVETGHRRAFSRTKTSAQGPHQMPRRVAERLERRLIRRFAREGLEVLNKQHNPQYLPALGQWVWQKSDPEIPSDDGHGTASGGRRSRYVVWRLVGFGAP